MFEILVQILSMCCGSLILECSSRLEKMQVKKFLIREQHYFSFVRIKRHKPFLWPFVQLFLVVINQLFQVVKTNCKLCSLYIGKDRICDGKNMEKTTCKNKFMIQMKWIPVLMSTLKTLLNGKVKNQVNRAYPHVTINTL